MRELVFSTGEAYDLRIELMRSSMFNSYSHYSSTELTKKYMVNEKLTITKKKLFDEMLDQMLSLSSASILVFDAWPSLPKDFIKYLENRGIRHEFKIYVINISD